MTWGYFGELCWEYLFGTKITIAFKIAFLLIVYLGAVIQPKVLLELSDLMFISIAFPNLLGCYFLSNDVALDMKNYMYRLRRGELEISQI